MGKTDSHHLWQKAVQKKIFGRVIDDRTIELPERYHEKKINPLQQKGVGDAYLAGLIDHDFATGEIEDYDDDYGNDDFEDEDD
jgi:hypothetical protein